jgi:hypothetical protein
MGFVLQGNISVTFRLTICLEKNLLSPLSTYNGHLMNDGILQQFRHLSSMEVPAAGRWGQEEKKWTVSVGYIVSPGQPGLAKTYLRN